MVTSAVVPALPTVDRRAPGIASPTRSTAVRPMPVPTFPSRPDGGTYHGISVLDRYGRVADRSVLRAVAWGPGRALAVTLVAGSLLACPMPDGPVRIGNDGYLRIPVGVRRACHLYTGDRILLVADPAAGRLFLHPPAVLAALLDAHHANIARGATA